MDKENMTPTTIDDVVVENKVTDVTPHRITKVQYYKLCIDALTRMQEALPGVYDYAGLKMFLANEMRIRLKQSDRERVRRANMPKTDDGIKAILVRLLNDKPQVINTLWPAVQKAKNDPSITIQLVTRRLAELIDEGKAIRENVYMQVEKNGVTKEVKFMGYRKV